jgi:hypothetical protein
MTMVWVQLWTAKVPNSVAIDKSDLEKIEGLRKSPAHVADAGQCQ